jgi:hypothetical protein
MAVTMFTCTSCRSTLRSPKALTAGTKIKCPKCGAIFALPASDDDDEEDKGVGRPTAKPKRGAQADDGVAEYDDGEDYDAYQDEDSRPRRKKKKAKVGNQNLVMILGISGLVLLLAGGALTAFVWPGWLVSRAGSDDPLAYLPANSTLVAGVEIETLLDQTGLGSMLALALGNKATQCKEETGMEIKELFQQLTVATTSPIQSGANLMAGGGKFVAVTRSKEPFDPQKIAKLFELTRSSTIKGLTCYKPNSATRQETFLIPTKRLIVMTNFSAKELEDHLGAIKATPILSAETLSMIETARKNHAWAALPFTPAIKQNMQQSLQAMPATPGQETKALKAALPQSKAAAIWANLQGNQVKISAGLMCADSASASQVAAELQKSWESQMKGIQGTMMTTMLMAFIPKGPLQDVIKELMKNIKFGSQDTMAMVSTEANIQALKNELPKLAMGGMMGGAGALPGPGRPGFPGPAGGGMNPRPNVPNFPAPPTAAARPRPGRR